MKTSKILISLLVLGVLLTPVLAMAQPGVTITGISGLYEKVADILWQIVGLIALIMFVIAGIIFMTAQGDPTKVTQARMFVLWGVVGIIVAILAYSIIAIVESFF